MSYNLTIDQGNSSTKLVLWDENGVPVESWIKLHATARGVLDLLKDFDIDTAIYCTVGRKTPALMASLNRKARHTIDFSVKTPTPLEVDYGTPHTLGLDRLAAAVGAFSLNKNTATDLLVVDLGTAITYDRVTTPNIYRGGNIAPGVKMRLKALNHYTARLPLVNPYETEAAVWGDNTRNAMQSGAVRGVVAELEYYRRQCSADVTTVLTGGDAPFIAPLLSFETIIEPNLVSKGLNDIIAYNK